ncbi:MAG: NfeD family protein [Opitutaceae bacterium]
MTLILALFIGGVVLLAIDVFLSSFILAAAGAAAMAAAVGLVYAHFGGVAAIGAGAGAALLLTLTIYFELGLFPRTRWGRGLVVHSTSGTPASAPPAEVVGKVATAATTLAPSGYVLVEGRRYEAFCQAGHASAGADLRVVGVDQFRLIVAPPR